MGRQIIYREQQAPRSEEATERHLAQFALD
jgi:hypothetical protein